MSHFGQTIKIKSKKKFDIVDMTIGIKELVGKSNIKNGILNIQSLHTTATIFINEKETELLKDICNHLENLAPENENYFHDDFNVRTENICEGECANGHSHCKALHLPTSITLNIVDGKLKIGRWQRILFIELDRPRDRQIHLAILGD